MYEKLFADFFLDDYELSNGNFKKYDVIDKRTAITFEVKRDYWYNSTKNILIEEYFNLEAKTFGWIHYTKADFLVVFVDSFKFYMLPMAIVKFKWFYKNKLNIDWQCKDIKQKGFHTRNWLVQLEPTFVPEFYTIWRKNV